MIVDLSAVWWSLHNVADWIAKGNNPDLENMYPTVRKGHDVEVLWLTYLIENNSGGPPGLSDSQTWAQQHDPYVPILVDENQNVAAAYGVGSIPHFFLLGPVGCSSIPQRRGQQQQQLVSAVGLIDANDF